MSKKMGRPCKDNPKDTRIQVRLDKETLKKLDECAKEKNTTRSEVIREGIDLVNDELQKK
ncbi:MAG: CopG family transcriptional regulator [Ruminococcus sp.]|nr:CopG family transcriptional regulator [Ruminococcus sp.]